LLSEAFAVAWSRFCSLCYHVTLATHLNHRAMHPWKIRHHLPSAFTSAVPHLSSLVATLSPALQSLISAHIICMHTCSGTAASYPPCNGRAQGGGGQRCLPPHRMLMAFCSPRLVDPMFLAVALLLPRSRGRFRWATTLTAASSLGR